MSEVQVCPLVELEPGGKVPVTVGRRTIVVCRNAAGELYAVSGRCPHQGAALCEGTLDGTSESSRPGNYMWGREGEILRCPWHAWEFDVTDGSSLFGESRVRLATYPVNVVDGIVYIDTQAHHRRE